MKVCHVTHKVDTIIKYTKDPRTTLTFISEGCFQQSLTFQTINNSTVIIFLFLFLHMFKNFTLAIHI